MKGIVTYFNLELNKGSIQADDGRMLSFDRDSLSNQDDVSKLVEGLRVEFSVDGDLILKIEIQKEQCFLEDTVFYIEPSQIGIAKDTPQDFELIDKATYTIQREARSSKAVKLALIDDCRKLGGNVVLDYKEVQFERNSIGFSYYMYKASGVVGIIATKSDVKNDELPSLLELKNRINHQKIKELHDDSLKSKLALKVAKIAGGILFVIFALGFIFGK